MRFVANIELLFTEAGGLIERMHAAAEQGFDAVEFWRWEDVDLDSLAAAARSRGVEIFAFVTDWTLNAADPVGRERFAESVRAAVAAARTLGARRVVVTLGNVVAGQSVQDRIRELVRTLAHVAPHAHAGGITLLVEPVNDRIDHPGSALTSTAMARAVISQVDHPAVRLLFDVYHCAAQGEDVVAQVAASAAMIDYVQVADAPGRHEPGSATILWPQVAAALAEARYDGPIGFEFVPSADSTSAVVRARRAWVDASRS